MTDYKELCARLRQRQAEYVEHHLASPADPDALEAADAIESLQAQADQLKYLSMEHQRIHDEERDALRAKLEAAEMHKAAAPLCEKHAPNGGARSGCLVCSGMRLSGALSEIDYICGEPNEYESSLYDADFDGARVVDRVKALRAKEQQP